MEIDLKSNTEVARCSEQLDSSNIHINDGVVPEVPVSALEGKCVFDVVSVRVKKCTRFIKERFLMAVKQNKIFAYLMPAVLEE